MIIVKLFHYELAGLPETANSIFKVVGYLRIGNNDFPIGWSWCLRDSCIDSKTEEKKHFLFLNP